jgi:dienelactone hydrolase
MLQTSKIEYVQGDTVLEGYCVLDDSYRGSRPAVIVAPDWSGRNDFACQKAEQLAELGYVGFALDMYGQGKVADTKEERTAAIAPLMADRSLLAKRVLAAYWLLLWWLVCIGFSTSRCPLAWCRQFSWIAECTQRPTR